MSKILVADDSPINLGALKITMQDLNVADRCEYFSNGAQVIKRAREIFELNAAMGPKKATLPIKALVLDFHMP